MTTIIAPWHTWTHAARMRLRKRLPQFVGKDDLTPHSIHEALGDCFTVLKTMTFENQSYLTLCQDIFREYGLNGAVTWDDIKTGV